MIKFKKNSFCKGIQYWIPLLSRIQIIEQKNHEYFEYPNFQRNRVEKNQIKIGYPIKIYVDSVDSKCIALCQGLHKVLGILLIRKEVKWKEGCLYE